MSKRICEAHGCNNILKPVDPAWQNNQYLDALHVELNSGFGEYGDLAISGIKTKFVICQGCAEKVSKLLYGYI